MISHASVGAQGTHFPFSILAQRREEYRDFLIQARNPVRNKQSRSFRSGFISLHGQHSPALSQPVGVKASDGKGTRSKRAQGSSAQPPGSEQHSFVGNA